MKTTKQAKAFYFSKQRPKKHGNFRKRKKLRNTGDKTYPPGVRPDATIRGGRKHAVQTCRHIFRSQTRGTSVQDRGGNEIFCGSSLPENAELYTPPSKRRSRTVAINLCKLSPIHNQAGLHKITRNTHRMQTHWATFQLQWLTQWLRSLPPQWETFEARKGKTPLAKP